MSYDRRAFLQSLAASTLVACDRTAPTQTDAWPFPGKAKDLVLLTDRPPNLETPLHSFRQDLTPNEAFFVRWHLPPPTVDRGTWKLELLGHVERALSLGLDELRKLPDASVVAVNQCSGNGRSLFAPRIPGVQWGNGALGCARFRGVRLAELLDRAGVKPGAVEVTFQGLDAPALPTTPAYVKSLSLETARAEDVLVAYEMNGAPLPPLNGFPARLVVPGLYSTYWVKALSKVTVLDAAFEGFWMKKGYRVPKTEGAHEAPDALAKETSSIGKMNVRSLLVRPGPDERVAANKPTTLEGIAFDSGTGIARVEVSTDGGASWQDAPLDEELGKYAFRRFRLPWTPSAGKHLILVRATSVVGEQQRREPVWNRSGYMQNVIERREVTVA